MALRKTVKIAQRRANKLVTGPASEPITLESVKDELRIDDTSDDRYLEDLISEARQFIEYRTGLTFLPQTWRLSLDNWPNAHDVWWDGLREGTIADTIQGGYAHLTAVELPRYPLNAITSVTTYDETSNATVVTVSSTFDVDTEGLKGRIALRRGATWPAYYRAINGIEIVYVAGYADVTAVPAVLKRALRQLVAYLYEHRGDGCTAEDAYRKSGASSLVESFAVVEV